MTLRVRVQGPAGPASEYPLDGEELSIGRAANASIVIPDARVSRQHARFVRREGAWWIEDLGARNRTVLNGAPVREPSKLRPGDRLEVGDVILRVFDDGPGSSPTTI